MGRLTYPRVSFIIPTLNEEKNLPRCLTAIRSQVYPQNQIEIIIADGGSTDRTIAIAKSFQARIYKNKIKHQEPGKTMAAELATGDILFYTDADNVLATTSWIADMVKPFKDDASVMGFLPQTIPAPDTNSLDKYLGFLGTEPFTWFVYGKAASPKNYSNYYTPLKKTDSYILYQFPINNHPLLGLAQGFGTNKSFKRDADASGDDITAGIRILEQKGKIAYIPKAGIYHYHIDGFNNFYKKYTWRVRNNLRQTIAKMGLVHRKKYYSPVRKLRMILFIPYSFSLIIPWIDSIAMAIKYKNRVMLWHLPVCLLLTSIIIKELVSFYLFNDKKPVGTYEK